jgi:hypothetical protein
MANAGRQRQLTTPCLRTSTRIIGNDRIRAEKRLPALCENGRFLTCPAAIRSHAASRQDGLRRTPRRASGAHRLPIEINASRPQPSARDRNRQPTLTSNNEYGWQPSKIAEDAASGVNRSRVRFPWWLFGDLMVCGVLGL